jgi:hypothetical protein
MCQSESLPRQPTPDHNAAWRGTSCGVLDRVNTAVTTALHSIECCVREGSGKQPVTPHWCTDPQERLTCGRVSH